MLVDAQPQGLPLCDDLCGFALLGVAVRGTEGLGLVSVVTLCRVG